MIRRTIAKKERKKERKKKERKKERKKLFGANIRSQYSEPIFGAKPTFGAPRFVGRLPID